MDLDEQAKQWLVDNALPPPPVHRRYLTNDSTVEKLAVLLEESPHGLMIFRDELVGFLKMLDKDGYESDRAFYLEGWNGNGDHAVDRISRGSSIVKGVCLSVFGGIQPGVVAHWLNQATRQGSGDDGLIQRFQLLVWPDEPAAYLNVDTVPDLVAKHRFYHLVEQLACLDPVTLGAHQDEFDTLPYLHFSQEAQPIFSQWNTDLRNQAKDMHTEPAPAAHLAKYPKLIPALALICPFSQRGQRASK